MISLQFGIDDAVIERDLAEGGPVYEIDEAAWFMTWFELPIRFAVGDVELLGRTPCPPEKIAVGDNWTTVPRIDDSRYTPMALVGFAVTLYREARSSQGGPRVSRIGPLRIERSSDGGFHIEGAHPRCSAVVSEAELRDASAEFLLKVEVLLLSRAPEIVKHPNWGDWFPASQALAQDLPRRDDDGI